MSTSSIPSSSAAALPTPAEYEIPVTSSPQTVQSPARDLIPVQTFNDISSPFCQSRVDITKSGGLAFVCADGKFTFLTPTWAKDNYKYLQVSVPIRPTSAFTIEADLTSWGVLDNPDQNNYGFVLGIDDIHTYSLRFKGQYFRFEKNLIMNKTSGEEGDIHIRQDWNRISSPFFKPTGNLNHVRLTCAGKFCDLTIDQNLAARFNLDQEIKITSLALFAEVGYFRPFGSVDVDNLHVFLPAENATQTALAYRDPLVSDKGIFSKTNLSGAYNSYQADGLHFSPMIPLSNNGVRTDPALGDVSISASVALKTDSSDSSPYAGLVCRSSAEGMYLAVIRANGHFSVYRDSPSRPFTPLKEASSKEILTGSAINQLRLDCVGSTITFYINSVEVASLQNKTFNLVFGRSGLFTKAGKIPDEAAITFSNLEIKEVR